MKGNSQQVSDLINPVLTLLYQDDASKIITFPTLTHTQHADLVQKIIEMHETTCSRMMKRNTKHSSYKYDQLEVLPFFPYAALEIIGVGPDAFQYSVIHCVVLMQDVLKKQHGVLMDSYTRDHLITFVYQSHIKRRSLRMLIGNIGLFAAVDIIKRVKPPPHYGKILISIMRGY